MRKIFFSALALFVVSFIGFAITAGILGGRYAYAHYSPVISYESRIFSGDYSESSSWTVHNVFPYVNINSSGVKTVIGRSESDDITINLINPSNKTVHVEAAYTDEQLTIEARPTNITFDLSDIKFGITSWLEDIFSGNSDVTVMIGFPEAIYERICIQQGSGTMQINDLYSRYYDVKIGSGKCEFSRSSKGGFMSSGFDLDLGSGSAVFNGMESESYNIDIGSGKFNLSKLSGRGRINMGSGSGEICFAECGDETRQSHRVNIGSGNLVLYFPAESGITIDDMDIGSGKIDINAYGAEETFSNSNCDTVEEVTLGTGAGRLDIDMGSGYVAIRDSSTYTAPEIVCEYKMIIDAVVIDGSSGTYYDFSSTSETELSGLITSGGEQTDVLTSDNENSEAAVTGSGESAAQSSIPNAPQAPDAPEAPSAPDAPKAPNAPSTGETI